MAGKDFDKRDFLRLAGGGLIASVAGARALAQDGRILGLDLPKQVVDLIPRKPLNYLRIAESVVQLEREADRRGFPESPLETRKGESLAAVADSLYQVFKFLFICILHFLSRNACVNTIGFHNGIF